MCREVVLKTIKKQEYSKNTARKENAKNREKQTQELLNYLYTDK